MQVDEATVRRIARLARIKITDEEAASSRELSGILDWVEQLDEVDTEDVEPMTRVADMSSSSAPTRSPTAKWPTTWSANAPMSEDHFFVVPKVVE